MFELSQDQALQVAGGSPVALLGFALAIIVNAGAINDFANGVFDGFNRL